jgi:N-acetylmuramic acid 6-phosphate etherase
LKKKTEKKKREGQRCRGNPPSDRSTLTTEKRNCRSRDIDLLPTLKIVRLLNREDAKVAPAVGREARQIAAAADLIAAAFQRGGRLFYVGAGTSGRLGVLDAAECPPTFGTPPHWVQGLIAGGKKALVRTAEGAEDRACDGAAAMKRNRISAKDVVVGIAACGLTPFVLGALAQAQKRGARTVFVTCNPEVRDQIRTDVLINPVVGPEVLTGSTRMKAGTAAKLVLNSLTTAAMIRSGKTYGNLMVDLRATNVKLRKRSERIVMAVTGLARPAARKLLDKAGGAVKTALLMHLCGLSGPAAKRRLAAAGGFLRRALEP